MEDNLDFSANGWWDVANSSHGDWRYLPALGLSWRGNLYFGAETVCWGSELSLACAMALKVSRIDLKLEGCDAAGTYSAYDLIESQFCLSLWLNYLQVEILCAPSQARYMYGSRIELIRYITHSLFRPSATVSRNGLMESHVTSSSLSWRTPPPLAGYPPG